MKLQALHGCRAVVGEEGGVFRAADWWAERVHSDPVVVFNEAGEEEGVAALGCRRAFGLCFGHWADGVRNGPLCVWRQEPEPAY